MKTLQYLAVLAFLPLTALPLHAANHGDTPMMQHHLKMMKQFDTDNNGTLTLEEFQNYTSFRFKELDSDRNKEISEAEFGVHMKPQKHNSCGESDSKPQLLAPPRR